MTKPIRLEEQLCFSLYTAQKQYNKYYATALAPFHLTYPQFIVLLTLWEHDTLTVNDLGHYLNLDSGTLTPLLKRLEKDDWVERRRDTVDERRVLIHLTQKALSQRDTIYDRVNNCLTHLNFTLEQYNDLKKEVDLITAHLQQFTENTDALKI
ncbi:MarR family winged helix-turn-helix transcriptional regulator [Loigolactobacillus coryniformis]|uniref:HTH-type transcriptional regulator SarZ n=1 Tax=Loigolactobacillus coryniformis TaxID=1610 RepID=A0A5B8TEN0_9LACO|nr:MarR family transcriptional regulator [Loigolactobacillus coryniformis]QEA52308.1 MarR family transcriptional regulator [Loigolactobacillus coryniformis]RRG04119.1 MAG: MarR family transcriptional regulator [Lactobacillus sp.]